MLDEPDGKQILSLQLLIARAAQKDSLSWWEDDSLTPAGDYLLERLFMANPGQAGKRLALEAAKVRYHAAFGNENNVFHLFHLDQTGDVEHNLDELSLSNITLPLEPIQTIDALRQALLEQIGFPMKYQIVGERSNNRLEIKLAGAPSKNDLIHLVKTLAWATLESEPGKPIFPYIQANL
jgi:hypothetical protein